MESLPSTVTKPTFRESLLFWLRLGFISFGGPAGQIALMHEFVADHKKWVSDAQFLPAAARSRSPATGDLPGLVAVRHAGWIGSGYSFCNAFGLHPLGTKPSLGYVWKDCLGSGSFLRA